MQKHYTINIANRVEQLPILQIAPNVSIAFFNLHGNVELTEHSANHLAALLKPHNIDIILTAESKGLQLSHCVARNLNHTHYAVARKAKKLYMQDSICVKGSSITTDGTQSYYLSAHDVALLNGKHVAIVDDVISTGASLASLEWLAVKAGGKITARAAVLLEGDATTRKDIIHLATIPIFT